MIKLDANTKKQLVELYRKKGIGLEGNITKLVDREDDEEFKQYLLQNRSTNVWSLFVYNACCFN